MEAQTGPAVSGARTHGQQLNVRQMKPPGLTRHVKCFLSALHDQRLVSRLKGQL